MAWDYSNILPPESVADTPSVASAPVAVSAKPVPTAFTEDDMRRIAASPAHVQTALAELLSQKLPPDELIPAVLGVLEKHEVQHAPIGNDIMVATPTGLGLNNELGIAAQQAANGQTTITEADIALLKSRVESTVKQMIASGASDDEIQKAVAQMGSTPELASMAQEMAQQQLDAEKFNLFNARGNEDQSASNMLSTVGAVVGGLAFAKSAHIQASPHGVTAERMPYEDLDKIYGSTTAFLASGMLRTPTIADMRDTSRDRGGPGQGA
jgi:hypothetical protein